MSIARAPRRTCAWSRPGRNAIIEAIDISDSPIEKHQKRAGESLTIH
jgi:hypothetical protein